MIAPAWAVLPLAAIVVAWALWYAWGLQQRTDITPKRRWFRTINAVVIVLLTGFMAYGLTGVSWTARPRAFVIAWTSAMSLALVMGALALLDSWHTTSLSMRAAGRLKRDLRKVRPPGESVPPER